MGFAGDKNQETKKEVYKKKIRKVEHRNLVSEVFGGVIRSSVQCCTCYNLSHTEEPFQVSELK